MITECTRAEACEALLEATAAKLRIVLLNPTVPPEVRTALALQVAEIETMLRDERN